MFDRRTKVWIGSFFGVHLVLFGLIVLAGLKDIEQFMALILLDFPALLILDTFGIEFGSFAADVIAMFIMGSCFYALVGFVFARLHAFVDSKRRKRRRGFCITCGYCLRGLIEPRCPECNTPFVEEEKPSDRKQTQPSRSSEE